MVRYSLLIFIILLETLQTVYCVSGKDSLNLFNPKLSKIAGVKNADPRGDEEVLLENNEVPPEEKIIEKRRLLFNEGEVNSPGTTGRDFENAEFSTRRQTNYTITETGTQIPEYQRGFNNWENKQSIFSFPTQSGNSRNLPDFRLRQSNSNQNLNWRQKTDIFGTEQSRWNEEQNLKPIASSESYHKAGNTYNGRVVQMIDESDANDNFHPGKKGKLLNRRPPMTALHNEGIMRPKNYENSERVGEMKADYLSDSNMNYYNRNAPGFWNPNFYRPEKGVIINFNTECPAPRQLSNQMVHKFIFTPKSPVSTLPEISPYQIPETAFISTHKRPPMYYLKI